MIFGKDSVRNIDLNLLNFLFVMDEFVFFSFEKIKGYSKV